MKPPKTVRALAALVVLALAVLILAAAAPADVLYNIIELEPLPGQSYSGAWGMNNLGEVVGWSCSPYPAFDDRAVLWSGGSAVDLGTSGGDNTIACGINDAGWVVGMYDAAGGHVQAFLWREGVLTDLDPFGPPPTGWSYNGANDVNNSGVVVGFWGVATGRHAFAWTDSNGNGYAEPEEMTDLGNLGVVGQTNARALNELGEVVGSSWIGDYDTHGFLWSENDGMTDLGTLGGDLGYARDINDAGQVVGSSTNAGGEDRAFLWEGGVMSDLGTLGGDESWGYAINEAGQVVGRSRNAANESRPFLWEGGVMSDLNDLIPDGSGWLLTQVWDINDAGQIAGRGLIGGESRGFLLTPIPAPGAVVLGIFGVGFVAVIRKIRRR